MRGSDIYNPPWTPVISAVIADLSVIYVLAKTRAKPLRRKEVSRSLPRQIADDRRNACDKFRENLRDLILSVISAVVAVLAVFHVLAKSRAKPLRRKEVSRSLPRQIADDRRKTSDKFRENLRDLRELIFVTILQQVLSLGYFLFLKLLLSVLTKKSRCKTLVRSAPA